MPDPHAKPSKHQLNIYILSVTLCSRALTHLIANHQRFTSDHDIRKSTATLCGSATLKSRSVHQCRSSSIMSMFLSLRRLNHWDTAPHFPTWNTEELTAGLDRLSLNERIAQRCSMHTECCCDISRPIEANFIPTLQARTSA